MGRRTIGRRWPSSASSEDYVARCDYCGVPWMRSQLRIDTRGLTVCREHGDGADAAELSMLNAEAAEAWAQELASRPVRDRGGEYGPEEHYPFAGSGYWDASDPGLPTFAPPTRSLVHRWDSSGTMSLTGVDINTWTDSVGGLTFAPAGGAFEYRTGYVPFLGKPAVINDMVSANSRMVAGVAADWTFLSDGSGCTVIWVAQATATIALNTSGGTTSTARGFQLRVNSTDSARFRAGNGTASVFDILPSGIVSRSAPSMWVATYGSAEVLKAQLRRGLTLLGSSAETAAPSASAPVMGLELRADVTTPVATRALLIYNSILTDDEINQAALWAAQDCGAVVQ